MDYEKAYKKALARAKSFITDDNKDVAMYIFPELRANEDEDIKAALIDWFDGPHAMNDFCGIPFDHVVSWLKRQGGQNWSEEDSLMVDETIFFIKEFQKSDMCKNENDMQNSVTCENWLRSLISNKRV